MTAGSVSRWTVTLISPTASTSSTTASVSKAWMASATPSLEAYLGAGLLISAFDRSNATNFPLELHHAVKKRFCCRRATRHINIHRHDPVTAAHNAIAIVVLTPAIRATAPGNDIFGLAHLIVDLPQRRSHLVAERTSNDPDTRLERRSTRPHPAKKRTT